MEKRNASGEMVEEEERRRGGEKEETNGEKGAIVQCWLTSACETVRFKWLAAISIPATRCSHIHFPDHQLGWE